jgi:hypothetical protein
MLDGGKRMYVCIRMCVSMYVCMYAYMYKTYMHVNAHLVAVRADARRRQALRPLA